MNNYAIDTAARFGDIPFVEFTKELVTGVFDSLVEAHILQMEEYANFVSSLTEDLSTYINNTQDGVSFEQISDFVLAYDLPAPPAGTEVATLLEQLEEPATGGGAAGGKPAADNSWWGGLINGLDSAVMGLVGKIKDGNQEAYLNAIVDYNKAVSEGASNLADKMPTYKQIHDAIAALIVSTKYGLLQTIAKQGVMRLVVTEGEIETKITFSTWNSSSFGRDTTHKDKAKRMDKLVRNAGGGIIGIFKAKRNRKQVNRTVTVNTAKSYQRDSSGTKVDIFGRVLIKFKTDYAPLNG